MHQLNLALTSLLDGFRAFKNPGFLLPLFANTIVQLVVLSLLLVWHHPAWSGAFAKLLSGIPWVGGDGVLHYPNFYARLPAVFAFFNFILIATVSAYLWGVAVLTVAKSFGARVSGSPWSVAASRFPALMLGSLPLIALGVVAFMFVNPFLASLGFGGPLLLLTRYGVVPAYSVIAQSLFLFVPMAILIEGRGALGGIRRALGLWTSNIIASIFLVAIVAMWHLGTNYFFNNIPEFMDKFRPELVAGILGGDLVLSFFTHAVLAGAATAMFLSRRGGEAAR